MGGALYNIRGRGRRRGVEGLGGWLWGYAIFSLICIQTFVCTFIISLRGL